MKNQLTTVALILFIFTLASFYWMIHNVFCQLFYDESINIYSIASFVVFGLFFFRIIFSMGEIDEDE